MPYFVLSTASVEMTKTLCNQYSYTHSNSVDPCTVLVYCACDTRMWSQLLGTNIDKRGIDVVRARLVIIPQLHSIHFTFKEKERKSTKQ